jgi:hypothetical protein
MSLQLWLAGGPQGRGVSASSELPLIEQAVEKVFTACSASVSSARKRERTRGRKPVSGRVLRQIRERMPLVPHFQHLLGPIIVANTGAPRIHLQNMVPFPAPAPASNHVGS